MPFQYVFNGIYIGKNYKQLKFEIYKFDDGKYLKKNMHWENDNPSISVNTLQSTFVALRDQDPPVLTIAKKSEPRIDQFMIKEAARQADSGGDFATLNILFTAFLNGNFLARQKLELVNIGIVAKATTRIKGLGNLTVLTFEADNAVHTTISEDEYYNSLGD